MLSHFIELIKKGSQPTIKPLGRWGLNNIRQTNLKVNYANEDHCGTCAEYIVQKKNKQVERADEEEYYKYMMCDNKPDFKKN